MTVAPCSIVVTDENVLINLIHIGRLDICSRLPGYEFIGPDHVRDEIKNPNQRKELDNAAQRGVFRVEAITDLAPITFYAALGLITLEEADKDKVLLEGRRFRMPFGSFREVITPATGEE